MAVLPCGPLVDGGSTGAASLTLASVTIVNGQPLCVCIVIRDSSQTVNSVLYGAVALTQKKSISSGADCKAEIWNLDAPAIGTDDVVITLSGSTAIRASSYEIWGSTGYHSGATNSGSGTAASVAYSHTDGKAMIDCLAVGNAAPTSLTADVSQEEKDNSVSGQIAIGVSDKHAGTGWSDNMAWTLGASQSWALAVVEYDLLPIYASGTGAMGFSGHTTSGNPALTPGFAVGVEVNGIDSASIDVEVP